MTNIDDQIVGALVEKLLESGQAQSPAEFLTDEHAASQSGLYSWWADETARRVIAEQLGQPISPLIYAGQAGATRMPSGKRSKATLASRIRGQHINGNASSSTFRLTISALLLAPRNLEVLRPGRLVPAGRELVSDWINEYPRVRVVSYSDRDTLGQVEEAILKTLDPPLNLKGMPRTHARTRLTQLRRAITYP